MYISHTLFIAYVVLVNSWKSSVFKASGTL